MRTRGSSNGGLVPLNWIVMPGPSTGKPTRPSSSALSTSAPFVLWAKWTSPPLTLSMRVWVSSTRRNVIWSRCGSLASVFQ